MEAEFQQQEALRKKTEQKKRTQQTGVPEAPSVEAQFPNETKQFMLTIDNSAIRDYIKREHEELHSILEEYSNKTIRSENKQESKFTVLESEVSSLTDRLSELLDNFNLFVSQERTERKLHRERVQATCNRIDEELAT
jgi:hypothetical protein